VSRKAPDGLASPGAVDQAARHERESARAPT
jgi:hypothetical protein